MIINDVLNSGETFRYQLLSRMQMDCDYYLSSGKNQKHFWAGNEQNQIDTMIALWESFSEDKKPEWLTMEKIKEYENKIIKDRN